MFEILGEFDFNLQKYIKTDVLYRQTHIKKNIRRLKKIDSTVAQSNQALLLITVSAVPHSKSFA